MEVRNITDELGRPSKLFIFEPHEYAVKTGAVTGLIELEDGKVVNVTEDYVLVDDQAQADELMHKIALVHVEKGHPDDVDYLTDPDSGQVIPVQRPFVYDDPNIDGVTVGVGTPHGEHPLDEANNILPSAADPRIAQSKES